MRHYIVLLVFLLFQQTACTNQVEVYKHEADAFCKLHHPDQWKSRAGYSALENFDYLAERIRGTIKSGAFLDIFERLSKQGYVGFYEVIQPEISKLVGQDWRCEDAKAFYTIKWERAGAGKKEVVIEIAVLKDGMFKIHETKYKLSNHEGINKAVQAISKRP